MEITKSEILKLIVKRKTDSFWNHLLYVLSKDFKCNGEVKDAQIKVWKQGSFLGAFYPIYTFELNSQNNLTNISDRLNPIGKVLFALPPIVYVFLFIKTMITDFHLIRFIILLSLLLALGTFYFLLTRKIYNFEKQEQLNEIYDFLDIEVTDDKNKPLSKSGLIRLFTYPFCFFLTFIILFYVIPQGKVFLSIGTLSFVGAYLYYDLKK